MQTLEEKRVFIAINLPKSAMDEISILIAKLEKKLKYVKWTETGNLHITLQFLGNLVNKKIENLIKALEKLEGRYNGEMTFKLGNLNTFPNTHNPKILYLESKQQTGTSVLKLYKEILDELIRLNLEIDLRKWFPHITIGRVKEKIDNDIFKRYAVAENFLYTVNSFELMESQLTGNGPIYRVIKSFKF